MFNPEGKIKKSWDILNGTLVFYVAIFLSFKISFLQVRQYPTWDYIDYFVDFLFTLDLIFVFFTPYMNDNYVYVIERSKIAKNYIFSVWFFIDFISIFPFDFFFSDSFINGDQILFKAFSAPRFYKSIRMLKILRTIRRKNTGVFKRMMNYFKSTDSNIFVRNLPFFFAIYLSAHIFACLWHYFNSSDPNNWIVSADYYMEPNVDKYLAVIYFIYTTLTTTGYGDLVPVTIQERLICQVFMSLGVMMFAYIFDKMLTEMQEVTEKASILEEKYHELVSLKVHIDIDKMIFNTMKRVIKSGPPPVEQEVPNVSDKQYPGFDKLLIEAFDTTFSKFSFFQEFTSHMKNKFMRNIELIKFARFENIYLQNSPSEKCYFIKNGSVNLCFDIKIGDTIKRFEFVKLKPGCFFGLIEGIINPKKLLTLVDQYRFEESDYNSPLIPNYRYIHSAFADSKVEMYEIDRDKLAQIIEGSRFIRNKKIDFLFIRARNFEFWRKILYNFVSDEISIILKESDDKKSKFNFIVNKALKKEKNKGIKNFVIDEESNEGSSEGERISKFSSEEENGSFEIKNNKKKKMSYDFVQENSEKDFFKFGKQKNIKRGSLSPKKKSRRERLRQRKNNNLSLLKSLNQSSGNLGSVNSGLMSPQKSDLRIDVPMRLSIFSNNNIEENGNENKTNNYNGTRSMNLSPLNKKKSRRRKRIERRKKLKNPFFE